MQNGLLVVLVVYMSLRCVPLFRRRRRHRLRIRLLGIQLWLYH